jgi:hypothetical protein
LIRPVSGLQLDLADDAAVRVAWHAFEHADPVQAKAELHRKTGASVSGLRDDTRIYAIPFGVRITDLPSTPERLLSLIRAHG